MAALMMQVSIVADNEAEGYETYEEKMSAKYALSLAIRGMVFVNLV